MMRALVLAALVLTACGGKKAKLGARCVTSEECGSGLVCDSTQTPHVCNDKLANLPDLAGLDLAGVDLVTTPEDFAGQVVDMSANAPDLAREDLATPFDAS